jgi:adenylate cyclase
MKIVTRATEVVALQHRHNEDAVLAESALIAERRAALARLAMVMMFGVVTQTHAGSANLAQALVGTAYALFAAGMILGLRRVKIPSARAVRFAPFFTAVLDYGFLTALGLLDIYRGEPYAPGLHVVSCMIALSFSIGRLWLLHIAWQWFVCSVAFTLLAVLLGHEEATHIAFVVGGFTVFAFLLGLTNRASRKMFADLRRRDNLTRFLPQQVVERIERGGTAALAPIQREVSVLFSDIRGFTGLSETLEPRELLAMLDDYFGRMVQIVKGHDGVIGKFIGDGLLAYWNVPDKLEGHAAKAVAAARDMQRALVELNRERVADSLPPIKIGIGIHTGPVAAGMMGGSSQSEYTVIGDAVNVASRIEGLTKEHATGVLVSETTWLQLPEPRVGRRIEGAEIRGRKETIALYALDDGARDAATAGG